MKNFKNNTLKDLDYEFLRGKRLIKVDIDPYDYERIMSMINNDSQFFTKNGLMDYSLLLAIEEVNDTTDFWDMDSFLSKES